MYKVNVYMILFIPRARRLVDVAPLLGAGPRDGANVGPTGLHSGSSV